VDWFYPSQDRGKARGFVKTAMNLRIR
jgi:hypothetical protein